MALDGIERTGEHRDGMRFEATDISRVSHILNEFIMSTAVVLLLDWLATRFILTDRRLLVLRRPLWLRVDGLRLSTIHTFTLEVGLLGFLFGFGTLTVETAARRYGRPRFSIPKTTAFYQIRLRKMVYSRPLTNPQKPAVT